MQFVATEFVRAVATPRVIAESTYEVEIRPVKELAVFKPGQFLSVRIPGLNPVDLVGNSRDFSLASGPGDPLRVALRESDSHYKKALLGGGPVEVEVAGPYGFFTLPKTTDAQIVGVAGGIGVTPLVSMARHLTLDRSPQRMSIVTLDSAASRVAYRAELEDLARRNPNLRVVRRIGRVETRDELAQLVPELDSKSLAYLVGPPAMTGPMREVIRSFGLMPLAIMQEEFAGYARDDE